MSRQNLTTTTHPPSSRRPLTPLLLTNLRLLDLDRLPDWPSITTKSFSTTDTQQNQKQRIRCVEWTLYRLFELWDPDETREKLQPFFPPLEPLQSLNLRAALFRCLDQLKKNGVLGRECMLRKTMLDECKGERLMEVLLLFSTAVLRRVEMSERNGRDQPIAMRLATSSFLNAAQQGSLLPLSLALRADLGRLLRVKAEKKTRCDNFRELLSHKEQQLLERMKDCQKSERLEISPAEEAAIRSQLKANWLGDTTWLDAILHGDDDNPGDMPLKRPFNEVWNVIANGGSLPAETGDGGLLANLEHRITLQKERLTQWQTFQEKISSATGPSHSAAPQLDESKASRKVIFHFDKHQDFHLSRVQLNGDIESSSPASKSIISSTYAGIVDRMKKEIAEASKTGRDMRVRRLSPSVEEATQRRSSNFNAQAVQDSATAASKKADYTSPSGPNGPGPGLLGSTGSQSMSDRSTSVSSIFSPAKQQDIPEQPSSPADISITDILGLGKLKDGDNAPDASPAISETSPQVTERTLHASESTKVTRSNEDADPANVIITSVLTAAPTPIKPITLSLVERTRLSMASVKPQTAPSPLREEIPSSPTEEEPETPEVLDRRASLLERTRQSMSLLPSQGAVRSKKPMNKRPRPSSAIYPINQFETPSRPKDVPMRNSTPTEKLFSPDAEYSSVFKSRPKVALSPVFSPDDSTLPAIDSSSELDDSSLENVLSNSSPLAARIFSAEAK